MGPQTISAVLLSVLVVAVHGYSTGVENNVTDFLSYTSSNCISGNFRPNHGTNMAQTGLSNYTITVDSPSGLLYRPGQIVTVTIEKTDPSSLDFKGFFLRGDSTEARFAGPITCLSGRKVSFCASEGMTHNDALPKAKVVCKWTPPDFSLGAVQFQATVVQSFDTFWTGVMGNTVLIADPKTISYEAKALQLKEEMMAKFRNQGGMAGIMSQFSSLAQGQQGGSGGMANLMKQFSSAQSGQSGQTGQSNPFASMMGGLGKSASNIFGGGNGGGPLQNLQNIMGGFGGRGNSGQGQSSSNPFSSMMSQMGQMGARQNSEQGENANTWGMGNFMGRNNNANSESRGLERANLPNQFNQFFQPQQQKWGS